MRSIGISTAGASLHINGDHADDRQMEDGMCRVACSLISTMVFGTGSFSSLESNLFDSGYLASSVNLTNEIYV